MQSHGIRLKCKNRSIASFSFGHGSLKISTNLIWELHGYPGGDTIIELKLLVHGCLSDGPRILNIRSTVFLHMIQIGADFSVVLESVSSLIAFTGRSSKAHSSPLGK